MKEKRLILVTCTYERPGRLELIEELSALVSENNDHNNTSWIVVEDASQINEKIKKILPDFATYMCEGPTKDGGNKQRNKALQHIKDKKINGNIYSLDDDNKYAPEIFQELRKPKRFGFLPVGNLGPKGVERPVVFNGIFYGWDSAWTNRKFPVDMAGFVFDSSFLQQIKSPIWNHTGTGGETEFIEKIISSPHEAVFLCDDCQVVMVWHNGNRPKKTNQKIHRHIKLRIVHTPDKNHTI